MNELIKQLQEDYTVTFDEDALTLFFVDDQGRSGWVTGSSLADLKYHTEKVIERLSPTAQHISIRDSVICILPFPYEVKSE